MRRWVVLFGVFSSMTGSAEVRWEELRREGELRVEARRAPGDGYFEFRVTSHCRASPSAVADAVWSWNERGVEARMVERRLVVHESTGERLVWSLLRPPMVSARESLIRFKREGGAVGAVSITFQSEPGATPVSEKSGLRVNVQGGWRFEPDGQGGTRVEHFITSDPGGGLPAWLVKGAQEDMAVALVKEVVQRAEAVSSR